jgi:DNA polymerase-1
VTEPRKLVLLDGHSLAFRAFFALPDTLVTSSGQVTNAVYGFTSMLIKLLGDEKPDGVAVAFDRPKPTFRDALYTEYKAGRSETPNHFSEQLPLIREVLNTLNIPIYEIDGYEADDVIATFARAAGEEGHNVLIVSGDRDILQLVRPGVEALMTRRGISDMVRYDTDAVAERYGILPKRWTDFAALKGETSDNLPGVPGVGDKTAAKLVNDYDDVEGVIAHADELRPKIRDALLECADQVRLNKQLGRLVDDVPIEFDIDAIRIVPWDDEDVRKCFTSLEFPTLYERLKELDLISAASAPVLEIEELHLLGPDETFEPEGTTALATDGRWLALSDRPGRAVVLKLDEAPARLKEFLADPTKPKVAHDAKPIVRAALESGVTVEGLENDTLISAYCLDPGLTGGYQLADVCRRFLGMAIEEPLADPKQGTLDLEADDGDRAGRMAVATLALADQLRKHLEHRGMWDLAASLEFPLVGVLARMEHEGVLIDRDYLERLNEELGDRMSKLEAEIHRHAGEQFHVGSNPQLQRILFDKLGLKKTKRIKTGWSTDHAELVKLAGEHPIIDALLTYREVAKLKTGFTDALLPLVNPKTKRIHTTFMQASASTGRLASTNPNVQNIPIRGDLGRQIRRAFVAPEGHVLLSADYSQIELRVLAHLSGDEGFAEAFASGHDFHAAIAAKVYGASVGDVTSQMRAYAKQFSFGIAYGMSAYGVQQRLGIPLEEAETFIEAYYAQFPKLKGFLDAQVHKATAEGFTTTMFGRRRYLPELQSSNRRVRALGERMALNAPIQGSAADIIKKAMIDVDLELRANPGVATMLLSVHDELVFEVPDAQREGAEELVCTTMCRAADLSVGLEVDAHFGVNWDEAHA